jgi:prolyl oligopeptidase
MAWVNAENAKTTAVLEKDPRWESIYKSALTMAQAKDRLPYVSYIGGELYNFWQDSAHVRGIWRKTSLESYRSASPNWTTVLDVDALAKAEKANWVFHGYTCQQPAEKRCLVFLSDGGEDANTTREFDLASRSFVTNGFYLTKGKQRVAWTSQDTILVSREWNPGDVTRSGYPFIVKKLARGKSLADAVEIFRGSANDGGYGVSPATVVDAAGHRFSFIDRPTSTFEAEHYIVRPKDVARLAMPAKGNIEELIGGQVIVHLYDDWKNGGTTIRAGSVAAFDGNVASRRLTRWRRCRSSPAPVNLSPAFPPPGTSSSSAFIRT